MLNEAKRRIMRCRECNVPLSAEDNLALQLCQECLQLQIQQDEIFEVRDEAN